MTINVVLVVVLAGVAVLAFRATRGHANQTQSDLRTATVATGDVTQTVSTSATIDSARSVAVNFANGGTLTSVPVKVGQHVSKGQVIGRVDASSVAQQLVAAKVALASAKANLKNEVQTLGCSTAAACPTWADPQLLSAKSTLASAVLAVQQDRTQLAQAILRALMAGTVVELNGAVGETVAAGTTGSISTSSSSTGTTATDYVQIADLGRLVAVGDFSETDTARMKVGQSAVVTLDSLPDDPIDGRVTAIASTSTVVNNVVDYEVTIRLLQLPSAVRLGETASAQVTTASATNVLEVPSAAVTTVGGQHLVTVVSSNGQTTRTAVQVGVEGDDTTEIVSGLSAGQQVEISTASTTTNGGFPGGGFPGGGFPGGGFPGGGFPGGGFPGGGPGG